MRLSASGLRRSLSTAAGSSTGTYSSLFATQSDLYKLYRPTYPDDLFATILSFHRTRGNGATTFAVDLAAGSGQATEKLGALFSLAVGVDESEQQIKQAKPTPSVEYRLGSAESCPAIDDRSADLVTVAQAFHWFDHLNFYREAHRILQPRGTLAIWSYSMGAPLLGPDLSASLPATTVSRVNDRLKSTFLETYSVILGPYWDAKRQLVDQEYVGLEPSKIAPSLYENETRARSLISLNMPLASVASM
jgi:SAM-dependent methyltransferase